ncbi:MAG: DegT/DnrJ/EryC1/StrS family aminotransferase [Bacteroidia bacterium]
MYTNYYFPSILTSFNPAAATFPYYGVNSGKNAIRLLLKSYKQALGTKVALPAFVCDSLKEAVLEEGFSPVYLDLKTDGAFWTDYSHPDILSGQVPIVILVHMFGFIHPDSAQIMNLCKDKKLFLLHDAAQSYGIDETILSYGSGIVYSFGPGKSTTAAGGAIIRGISKDALEKIPASSFAQDRLSRLFLKSRILGYRMGMTDIFTRKALSLFPPGKVIRHMSAFQQSAALACMALVKTLSDKRKLNYKMLEQAVTDNPLFEVAYDDRQGLYFKIIFKAKGNLNTLKTFLHAKNIPFFSIMDSIQTDKEAVNKLPNLQATGASFLELSSEACLPSEEVERVAALLKSYTE